RTLESKQGSTTIGANSSRSKFGRHSYLCQNLAVDASRTNPISRGRRSEDRADNRCRFCFPGLEPWTDTDFGFLHDLHAAAGRGHCSDSVGRVYTHNSDSGMPESRSSLRSVPAFKSRFPWTGTVNIVGSPGRA